MFNSFLNVFLNSIVMSLCYHCRFSILFTFMYLFCYFIIPLFYHTLILIALSEFFWVIIWHHFWCWVTLLVTLDNFLLVFYLTIIQELPCSKSVYTHNLQYALCWPTLNGSMLYYCFNHYINDISMVTLFEH